MAGSFSVRFDDWKGGDYGVLDPSRADRDQFSAVNMVVYDNGLIGVRPGLKPLTISGIPTHTVAPGPIGFDVLDDDLLIANARTYSVPMVGGAATSYAVYGSSATDRVRYVQGNGVLYSLADGTLYKHPDTSTTTAITTPEPLDHIVRWGYFMVGVSQTTPWRLFFNLVDESGPDYDSWPANNYVDIGNNDPIEALRPIFNTLYAGKKSGWWAISGVLGELASVREVAMGNGPIDDLGAAVTTDNRVVYWPLQSSPAWWNGDRVRIDDRYVIEPRSLPFTANSVAVTPTDQRVFLMSDVTAGTELLSWKDGAWTRLRTTTRLGGLAPTDVRLASAMPDGVIFAAHRATTVGDTVAISSYQHALGRPGNADDTWAAAVDPDDEELVTGELTLPTWWDGQGRQVMVRGLVVRFRKYPSGVADSLNFVEVAVDAVGKYQGGVEEGALSAWYEASEQAADADGVDETWRVNIGMQGYADGFQVRFPRLRGVAIRDVVAKVEVRGDRQ